MNKGEKEPYGPSRYSRRTVTGRLTEIVHEQGYGSLIYSYEPRSGWMYLSELDVDRDFRRQGVAKNLVQYSKELAGTLGARLMLAAVTSREAYDVVVAVFGEEHVDVSSLGPYMEPGTDRPVPGTRAMLVYEVPDFPK